MERFDSVALIFEFHRLGRIRLNQFLDAQARLFSCNFLCQVDYDLSSLSTRALLPTASALSAFSFLVGSCWCLLYENGFWFDVCRQADRQAADQPGWFDPLSTALSNHLTVS